MLLGTGGALHADSPDWHGKTVAIAIYPPSKLEIAGIGAEIMIGATGGGVEPGGSAGAKLLADNAIEDPAVRVARGLLLAARQQYNLVVAPDIAVRPMSNPHDLARAGQGVDLVLDVTSSSSVVQRPFSKRYWVGTTMTGRLIDVRTAKQANDTFCQDRAGGDPDPLTYDELVANNAARLKAILARQADACLEKFKVKIFNIPPNPTDRAPANP